MKKQGQQEEQGKRESRREEGTGEREKRRKVKNKQNGKGQTFRSGGLLGRMVLLPLIPDSGPPPLPSTLAILTPRSVPVPVPVLIPDTAVLTPALFSVLPNELPAVIPNTTAVVVAAVAVVIVVAVAVYVVLFVTAILNLQSVILAVSTLILISVATPMKTPTAKTGVAIIAAIVNAITIIMPPRLSAPPADGPSVLAGGRHAMTMVAKVKRSKLSSDSSLHAGLVGGTLEVVGVVACQGM